jgi:hypothetical protein
MSTCAACETGGAHASVKPLCCRCAAKGTRDCICLNTIKFLHKAAQVSEFLHMFHHDLQNI